MFSLGSFKPRILLIWPTPGSTSSKDKRTKAGKLGATTKGKQLTQQRGETAAAKKNAADASPSLEAAKSDSNDSDAWRANVDKVIEKLGEDDIESTDGIHEKNILRCFDISLKIHW